MTDSPLAQLKQHPADFDFDAAVRLLSYAVRSSDVAESVRFASPPNLVYPAAEVISIDVNGSIPTLTTNVMGLIGPSGVLPRGYTEQASAAERARSPSLRHFLDLVADRFVGHFAAAGTKYRPHRAAEAARISGQPDKQRQALLALIGLGGPGLAERLDCSEAALLYYAGFFASRPRSAERLAALASDWVGSPVQVEQFAGAWLELPIDQRSALPRGRGEGQFCRLGVDAAIGTRAWDVQARLILRVGPLNREEFERLLPRGQALGQMVALVRAYVGAQTGFAINLILARAAIPPLQLGSDTPPRLGWNSWITAPATARWQDATEALFDAEVVEAESTRARAA